MEMPHTKNLIREIWEKGKAINVQEENEHRQHVLGTSWFVFVHSQFHCTPLRGMTQ